MCSQTLEVEEPSKQPALNHRAVAALCFANCAHFYSIASIFSYAGFLAVDLNWASDKDSAGYVAGLLPTMLMLGRLPTSIIWGMIADQVGRRPALVISMTSVALGNLCFGLSTSLIAALTSRFFLLGCGNGFTSLMGLLSLEIAGRKRQAEVFSWAISAGSFIAMVGPALGAFTYGMLTPSLPALAPSLIGCMMGLASVAITVAWLPETGSRLGPCSLWCKSSTHQSEHLSAVLPPTTANSSIDPDVDEHEPRLSAHRSASSTRPHTGSLLSIICLPPMPLALLIRAGHGMALFGVFDVVPLWCIASIGAGGLALSEDELGTLLALAAAGQVVYTSLFMGRIVNRIGERASVVAGCAIAAVSLFLLPLVALVSTEPRVLYASGSAALIYCVHTISMLTAGTGVVAITTALCAQHPERSGQLNGVVAMTEGIGKMAGPAIAAPIFAWAISARPASTTPSGAILVFLAFAGIFLFMALLSALLPRNVEKSAELDSSHSRRDVDAAGVDPQIRSQLKPAEPS